jgi:hypothetical protein
MDVHVSALGGHYITGIKRMVMKGKVEGRGEKEGLSRQVVFPPVNAMIGLGSSRGLFDRVPWLIIKLGTRKSNAQTDSSQNLTNMFDSNSFERGWCWFPLK